ncbi:hypothetical protein L7F22_005462 [Adiantum nelumboides]|nr:hypothetical protein [Adiantum nelumboides]
MHAKREKCASNEIGMFLDDQSRGGAGGHPFAIHMSGQENHERIPGRFPMDNNSRTQNTQYKTHHFKQSEKLHSLHEAGVERISAETATTKVLNFSSAYHPQTDGQSEIANLTVLDLLKAYVTEVDQRSQWEKYLPLVEYAYNNTVHTSTGKAPFEVIEERAKSPLLLKVHGKIFAADEYSRDLKESFQKIKEAISIAQQKQKAAANKHRRALAFKENDWVLLKFPKVRLRHTTGKNPTGHQKYYAKLAKRYYGPFQILKPINEMAYQLKLPNHWLIHNAFHVSLLKPYKGEPPKEAIMEDPPEVEGQEEVLLPESVLRHEDKVLRNGKIIRRYLIKFKNYPFEDAKWMLGTQLKDSLHLVNAYNDSLE